METWTLHLMAAPDAIHQENRAKDRTLDACTGYTGLVARLVPAKEPCRICGYDRVEPDSPYCPFCGATRLM